ncbi:MAG: DinB family protein, partial [Rhodospirillaceae bacterium]|nr:DinB family protein [Rhodospirillaceae bacterium]
PSMAHELCADFDTLRRERTETDATILSFAAALTPETIATPLVYRTSLNPRDVSFPLGFALAHFFNHQTHHRGQAGTLLHQLGIDPGVTDLIALPGMERPAP